MGILSLYNRFLGDADYYGILRNILLSDHFLSGSLYHGRVGYEKKSYGRVRGWGSIAFIITVIVLGKIIDLYSIEIILILIFFGSLAQALISIKIPDIQIKKQTSFSSNAKALLKRRVIVFLFCAFLMLVSHGTYYGFYSIHLEVV